MQARAKHSLLNDRLAKTAQSNFNFKKLTFLPKCTVGENRSGRRVLATVPRTEASTGQKHSLRSERVENQKAFAYECKRPKGTAALTLSVDVADEKKQCRLQ